MEQEKKLIPLDEYNARAMAIRLDGKKPNGIACPDCGSEMYEYIGSLVYMSNPPMKDIHCESCGRKAMRYC